MRTRYEFGKFLKAKREAAGVTQAEVAEVFGHTTPQFISNVERGLCVFPLQLARKWTAKIKLSPNEFLKVRGELLLNEQRKRFFSSRAN